LKATLPTAILGRTGLEVTRLGFGTALNGPDRPDLTPEVMGRLLNAVLDSGINFLDTSYDYVDSEEDIGRSLSHRYSEFHLATKFGCTDTLPGRNNSIHVWTRDNLLRGLRVSLERLKRDSVDIVQLHNATVDEFGSPDMVDPMFELRRQGKVRWIGVSPTLPDLPTYLSWGLFDVFQVPYSALERVHEEWITKIGEAGAGVIIRGGIAQGVPGPDSNRADKWAAFEKAGLDDLREEGESRSAFVLRFTLTHPYAHTIVVGTTNLDHLRENVEAVLRGPLDDGVYREAKRRLDSIGESPAPAA
jgi:aryl-alcohol dehydrogenase-like predicted oxidoreductase